MGISEYLGISLGTDSACILVLFIHWLSDYWPLPNCESACHVCTMLWIHSC